MSVAVIGDHMRRDRSGGRSEIFVGIDGAVWTLQPSDVPRLISSLDSWWWHCRRPGGARRKSDGARGPCGRPPDAVRSPVRVGSSAATWPRGPGLRARRRW
jgi:hypothetical protein